jgi:hypothetical protein
MKINFITKVLNIKFKQLKENKLKITNTRTNRKSLEAF